MDVVLYGDAFLDVIIKQGVLGKVVAFIWVIESQKRGLLHSHMLINVADEDKPRTPEDVDKVVCAEIPDPVRKPRLYRTISSFNIHNKCGESNPDAPCMDKETGQCSKRFPKRFINQTSMDVDGFPEYRRRDNGITVNTPKGELDNRWVVPYNPYLSAMFDCHINVEVCSTISAIKYVHKYVYKGPDRAALILRSKNAQGELVYDEIKMHLDARYVCPPEAVYRIFGNDMHDRSHSVIRLQVHLPERQTVYFRPGNEQNAVEHAKDTTLTAWFKLNEHSEEIFSSANPPSNSIDSRSLHYFQIPEHFIFEKKSWKARKQERKDIGRMYTVSPMEGERYYLRVMLLHTPGAKSFEDLRTVNGETYATFKEAAIMAGYLADDKEYRHCLEDAALMKMPNEMRALFAYIIAFCDVCDEVALWNDFASHMTEDFRRTLPEDAAKALAYEEIRQIVAANSKNLTEIIPKPDGEIPIYYDDIIDTEQFKNESEALRESFNDDQRKAADDIIACNSNIRCFFIDGPGGTGKTYLYNALNKHFIGNQKSVINVAWSGIAATLLFKGQTVHSTFKLPVPTTRTNYLSTMKMESLQAESLKNIDVIIWDEAPMAPKFALEAVDQLLRDICKSVLPFGGKLIILGGDFRQVTAVIPGASRQELIDTSLRSSCLWQHFQTYKLTENIRARQGDESWRSFLLKMGNGELSEDEEGNIEIPFDLISNGNLVEEIYGDLRNCNEMSNIIDRAILTPKNQDSLEVNNQVLSLLPGEERVYRSIDEADCDDSVEKANFPLEFINSLTPTGFPPHELKLKKGAIVMLLRNLDIKKGLCNGTRLIIDRMEKYVLACKIACGSNKGKYVMIPRITICPPNNPNDKLPFKLRRRQFPLRLAFAMTINKSQGQTFQKVGLDLRKSAFGHGQLYVGCSRVGKRENLKILLPEGNTKTKNVVYKELL